MTVLLECFDLANVLDIQKRNFLRFLRQGLVKPLLSRFELCMCVLGAVSRLLLSEKPTCSVAIWAKIKVRSLCMYLFVTGFAKRYLFHTFDMPANKMM